MTCPHCGHEPPAGSGFCNACGARLVIVCASCGATPPPGSRFCNACGAELQEVTGSRGYGVSEADPRDNRRPVPSTPPSTRKVISFIFADLMGSTALQESLDPESVNRVMDAYYRAVRGPVEAAGGTVVQLLGDGVLCAFGIPRIAEDDALRAVRAAVGIQQAFREFLGTQQWLRVPIGLRVAVNTGEVVVSDEHPAGLGDPLNVAARLQQEARDGEVLIGQATRRLVAHAVTLEQAGVFALKGRTETVTAYRVVSLERPTGAGAAAFVGRDDELARISAVFEAAVAAPAARLAVVLGSPGLGKSRLIEEVARRFGDAASVVTAHCNAAGGATFAPIADALRNLLGADVTDRTDSSAASATLRGAIETAIPAGDAERARITSGIAALLAGSPASPEETFFVIRRLLTALAQRQPVVLMIDDLHWAEPLLLDLVEHLIQWAGGVPLFVLVAARPELRDLRSSLVNPGGLVSEVVTLAGLDAGAAMRVAANVIGASDLPAAVAAKVLATSEGNPLFVGELVRMLVDEGAIERQGERWVVGANLAALEMPPTIHALLAARIERLRSEERTVLERASVVGRHFSRGAVAALLSRNSGELDARLEALRRTELIERDTGWFLGEPLLRFHHVLIRDAAYRRLLKGTRAALHERLADWIEAQVGDAAEHDESIGWHLEQAHQHLRELGPLDSNGRALGERAAQRLAAAGRRALARDDLPVAADLLGRAIERLDDSDRARADLALDWCEALLSAGDVAAAAKAIDELGRFACEATASDQTTSNLATRNPPSRLRAWHTCFTGQLTVLTAPQQLHATVFAVAAAAEELAQLGDAAGEAKAHSVNAQAVARLGKVGASEVALDKALAAASRAGDRRRANAVLAGAPAAALWGPSPVTRASGRCLDVVRVLRITQGAPAVEAVALSCQGVLEALRGRTDAARRMIASSRKMVEELGIAHRLFEADAFAGRIDLLDGDAAAAERNLRSAYEGLRDLGLGIDAARAGALLARAQLAQGKVAEAEAASRESEGLAGDDLQAAIAWRGVRAEALASRGETEAAVELAQAAVAIAAATDALLDHADARLALAAALRAAGRPSEADAEERRAIELWEAKGATLLAERARREDVRVVPRPGDAPLSSSPPPTEQAGAPRRRVRTNALTSAIAAVEAAFAARDLDALAAPLSANHEELDHRTGATWGREEVLKSLRWFMRSQDPQYRNEILASLGEALLLSRRFVAAAGSVGGRFDVGEYGTEAICVWEADERGLVRRQEVFAADRLGDAVTRLYERYAELQPEDPEHERAAAVARCVAVGNGPIDPERLATTFAPSIECVDHRAFHTWSSRGAEEFLRHWREQTDLASGSAGRYDDVLALTPDAFLVRQTYSGRVRATGGVFETLILVLFACGPGGLIARIEIWEPGCEADALARFDALVASPSPCNVRRRVRPNAASALAARVTRAVAARNADDLLALHAEAFQMVHHPTRTVLDREKTLAWWRIVFAEDRNFTLELECVATLGERLELTRALRSASAILAGRVEGGAYQDDRIALAETDEHGLTLRLEVFAPDHLGDAIVRLYERHAQLLPPGPERERAAATARSVAAMTGFLDHDRMASAIASDIELVDHRLIGTWSARGAEAVLQHIDAWLAVGAAHHGLENDVLALQPDGLLIKRTFSGIDREGGGAFDGELLVLWQFGNDGRLLRWELFDADRKADALVRFDALAGPRAVTQAQTRLAELSAGTQRKG